MTESSPSAEGSAGGRPRAVLAAAALTAAGGLALVVYAVSLALHWLTERPDQPLSAALLVALSLGWGLALLACARGFVRLRRWAVGPVVTSGLVLAAVGWVLASGSAAEVVVGWTVVGLSAACVVSVLAAARHLG